MALEMALEMRKQIAEMDYALTTQRKDRKIGSKNDKKLNINKQQQELCLNRYSEKRLKIEQINKKKNKQEICNNPKFSQLEADNRQKGYESNLLLATHFNSRSPY